MKRFTRTATAIFAASALALTACDDGVEDTMDDMGDSVDETMDDMGDEMDDLGDDDDLDEDDDA